MNSAVINIKIQPETKMQAQEVAREFGFSLSGLINAFLKHLIRTKRITFSVGEEPSDYLVSLMKEAKEDRRKGKGSPIFDNAENSIKWLEKQGI